MSDHADTIRRIEELREEAERRGRHLMSDGYYSFTTARWEDVLWLLVKRQQAIDERDAWKESTMAELAEKEKLRAQLQQAIDERDKLQTLVDQQHANMVRETELSNRLARERQQAIDALRDSSEALWWALDVLEISLKRIDAVDVREAGLAKARDALSASLLAGRRAPSNPSLGEKP